MLIPDGLAYYAVWLYGESPPDDLYKLWEGAPKDAAETFASRLIGPGTSHLIWVRPKDGEPMLFYVQDESEPVWVAEQVRVPA